MGVTLFSRESWVWLTIWTLARVYLVFVLSLFAIAALPQVFGWHGTVIQSGSMEPKIKPGDVVLIKPLTAQTPISVGGVYQYLSPASAEPDGREKLRLHRVVSVNPDGTFVTSGDANRTADSDPLERGQVAGQALLLVPMIGLPGYWAAHGDHLELAVWAAATLLAVVVAVRAPRRSAEKGSVRPEDDGPSGGDPRGEPDSTDDGGDSVSASAASRRGVVGLGVGVVVFGAAGISALRAPSVAAFSDRTAAAGSTWTAASVDPLSLGSAASFALIARDRLSVEGPKGLTYVTGDLGTHPGERIDGFVHVSGSINAGNAAAAEALSDALSVWTRISGYDRQPLRGADVAGTVAAGVYDIGGRATELRRDIVLDGGGDPFALFVFHFDSLSFARGTTVTVTNGASMERVFWCSEGTITLGSQSSVRGTLFARERIFAERGTSVDGRLISLGANIALDATRISIPS